MKTCDVCFEYLEDDNPCCVDFRSEMERLGYRPERLGADWCVDAYAMDSNDNYLCDEEDGTFTYVNRVWIEDDNDEITVLRTFESAAVALEWVKTITKTEETN